MGLSKEDKTIDDESNWKGMNLLGKAITQVRDELLKSNQNNTNDNVFFWTE